MRTITKRLVGCGLATTKIQFFCFRGFIHDRAKGCAFVGRITEGLFFALTALAPVIGFSLFYFNGIGGFLGNNRFSAHQNSFQKLCIFSIKKAGLYSNYEDSSYTSHLVFFSNSVI